MVYLLKIVIFHGYVSHNQMVVYSLWLLKFTTTRYVSDVFFLQFHVSVTQQSCMEIPKFGMMDRL